MANKYLVIIDMQKTFIFSEEEHFNRHSSARDIVETLRRLPQKIRNFVSEHKSKFNYGILTKFVNTSNSSFVKYLSYCGRMASSEEIKLVDEIFDLANEYRYSIFEKNTYSIFKNRQVLDFLENNHITPLFPAGVCLEGCILPNAFDGSDLGYNVKIVENLFSSAYGKQAYDSGIIILKEFLPTLLMATE